MAYSGVMIGSRSTSSMTSNSTDDDDLDVLPLGVNPAAGAAAAAARTPAITSISRPSSTVHTNQTIVDITTTENCYPQNTRLFDSNLIVCVRVTSHYSLASSHPHLSIWHGNFYWTHLLVYFITVLTMYFISHSATFMCLVEV